ncbi:STAS domain-containing protein [Pontiellaceae bacterium B12227]|nr:STAS domain-containing protein [Pontiellaceae bacterium B12227]
MNLNPVQLGSILIIEVDCEFIDAKNSGLFKSEIMSMLPPDCDTVLDLGKLTFLDSSGLGTLLACMRRIRAAGNRLALCTLQPTVQSIVELVHLKRVIDIYETREQAVEALQNGG